MVFLENNEDSVLLSKQKAAVVSPLNCSVSARKVFAMLGGVKPAYASQANTPALLNAKNSLIFEVISELSMGVDSWLLGVMLSFGLG